MDLRKNILLGFLMLMVYPNMFEKSSGVLGHPSGQRLRRSAMHFCRVHKSYTQYYMENMMTLATDIINNPLYRRSCRSGCEISFLTCKTNVCTNGASANITDVLQRVMTMMYDIKDLIDTVRGNGNIQAQDNHILWIPITYAFSGINMGWNNATSLMNITLQAGRPVSCVKPAIEEFNGEGIVNELRRGYIVARDIIKTVRCSLNIMTDIC